MARDILDVSSGLPKRDILDLRTDAQKQADACATASNSVHSHRKALPTASQSCVPKDQAVIVSALREAVANINRFGRTPRRQKTQ